MWEGKIKVKDLYNTVLVHPLMTTPERACLFDLRSAYLCRRKNRREKGWNEQRNERRGKTKIEGETASERHGEIPLVETPRGVGIKVSQNFK